MSFNSSAIGFGWSRGNSKLLFNKIHIIRRAYAARLRIDRTSRVAQRNQDVAEVQAIEHVMLLNGLAEYARVDMAQVCVLGVA
jgi:hypothetical protein